MKNSTTNASTESTQAIVPVPVQIPVPVPPTGVRILKVGTCPSLSGKSQLTYHIGCTGDSDILIRVYTNSAAGFFSDEWVSLPEIGKHLADAPAPGAVTSFLLQPIFRGKSQNTPGFLFAVLKEEGLVARSDTKRRCYQVSNPSRFLAAIEGLIAKGTNLSIQEKVPKRKGQVEKSIVPKKNIKAALGTFPSTLKVEKRSKTTKKAATGPGRKRVDTDLPTSEQAGS